LEFFSKGTWLKLGKRIPRRIFGLPFIPRRVPYWENFFPGFSRFFRISSSFLIFPTRFPKKAPLFKNFSFPEIFSLKPSEKNV